MRDPACGFGDFLLVMVARLSDESATQEDVTDCLQQIDEAFGRQLDPAKEYNAYAALQLCQSIRKIMDQRS
jgi:hypothetical protein